MANSPTQSHPPHCELWRKLRPVCPRHQFAAVFPFADSSPEAAPPIGGIVGTARELSRDHRPGGHGPAIDRPIAAPTHRVTGLAGAACRARSTFGQGTLPAEPFVENHRTGSRG